MTTKLSKIDYKKELRQFYDAKVGKPAIVEVPVMSFIMIDGQGDPNTSQEYTDAIESLYSVAYTIKFTSKIKYGQDFGVMPLEGLWWAENMAEFSAADKKSGCGRL